MERIGSYNPVAWKIATTCIQVNSLENSLVLALKDVGIILVPMLPVLAFIRELTEPSEASTLREHFHPSSSGSYAPAP